MTLTVLTAFHTHCRLYPPYTILKLIVGGWVQEVKFNLRVSTNSWAALELIPITNINTTDRCDISVPVWPSNASVSQL